VDLVLRRESIKGGFDENRIVKHFEKLKKIQTKLKLKDPPTLDIVFRTMGSENENTDHDQRSFLKAAGLALKNLVSSRQDEGKVILKDILDRIATINITFEHIQKSLPEVQNTRRRDARNKFETALVDLPADSKRVESEIALLIEKMDVTEESVRFCNHVQSFLQYLTSSKYAENSVGRELDFTMQEMHREINTLGAKIGDAELSKKVVQIKSEMEKIREQVQNIE
jgi:uncharacterized protein (TIGR00255 family)